jgi:hypothetical protein
MTADTGALPLQHFIQAVQSQLDNAQTAMAVKARNLNLPLTFAIKDVTLDLRAHVEVAQSEIRIRPAGANDKDASVFHLVFTAITRPAIEENAVALSEDADDQSIDELHDELSDEDRRKLEWVGVRTVSKLREIEQQGGSRTVGRVTNLPIDRLRNALARASRPLVEHVLPVERPGDDPDMPPLIRVRGRNLQAGGRSRITVGGRPVAVVRGDDRELLLAPKADQWSGELAIESVGAPAMAMSFDLSAYAPSPHSNGADHGEELRT